MNISYKGDYALKVILYLANNYPDQLSHIEVISKRQDIPRKFLEQILLELKKGGFVESKKGANGGYKLSRKPKDISLGDVIRFIEGSVYPISCVDPYAAQTCSEVSNCVFYPIWREIGNKTTEIIDNIDFQSLAEKDAALNSIKALNFSI